MTRLLAKMIAISHKADERNLFFSCLAQTAITFLKIMSNSSVSVIELMILSNNIAIFCLGI